MRNANNLQTETNYSTIDDYTNNRVVHENSENVSLLVKRELPECLLGDQE